MTGKSLLLRGPLPRAVRGSGGLLVFAGRADQREAQVRGGENTLRCLVKVGGKSLAFLGSEPASVVGVKGGLTWKVADEWLLGYPEDGLVVA
jgi:hypothetical protein